MIIRNRLNENILTLIFTILRKVSLIIAIQACGDLRDQNDQQEPASAGRSEVDYPSMLVESQDELPECTKDIDSALAYAEASATLHTCKNGNWREVKLPTQAATGAKGEKGDKGDPGPPATSTLWSDPVTGTIWFIGGTYDNRLATVCTGAYRVPSRDEVFTAIMRGLFVHSGSLGGPTSAWYGGETAYFFDSDSTAYSAQATNRYRHGNFCIARSEGGAS